MIYSNTPSWTFDSFDSDTGGLLPGEYRKCGSPAKRGTWINNILQKYLKWICNLLRDKETNIRPSKIFIKILERTIENFFVFTLYGTHLVFQGCLVFLGQIMSFKCLYPNHNSHQPSIRTVFQTIFLLDDMLIGQILFLGVLGADF